MARQNCFHLVTTFSVQHGTKFKKLIFGFVLGKQEGILTFDQLLLPLTCSRFYLSNNIQTQRSVCKKEKKDYTLDVRRSPLVTLP